MAKQAEYINSLVEHSLYDSSQRLILYNADIRAIKGNALGK